MRLVKRLLNAEGNQQYGLSSDCLSSMKKEKRPDDTIFHRGIAAGAIILTHSLIFGVPQVAAITRERSA